MQAKREEGETLLPKGGVCENNGVDVGLQRCSQSPVVIEMDRVNHSATAKPHDFSDMCVEVLCQALCEAICLILVK